MSLLSFLVFYDWLFLAIAFGVILYLRAARHRNYWRDQNVPHEKFSLFFGHQMKQLFKPIQDVDQELCNKYGRLFGSFEDGKPVLYVTEPDLVKLILVKDARLAQRKFAQFDDPVLANIMLNVEYDQWKKLRSATSPAFTSGKLRRMQDIISSCATVTSERLKKAAAASEDVDMKGFYGHFALEAVASCSFGAKLSSNSPEEESFIRSARDPFFVEISPSVMLSAFLQKLGETFRKRMFNVKSFEFYKNATVDIIKKREASKIVSSPFYYSNIVTRHYYQEDIVETTEELVTHNEVMCFTAIEFYLPEQLQDLGETPTWKHFAWVFILLRAYVIDRKC